LSHIAYLSLGTNLGDKQHNLESAIVEIAKRVGVVQATSAFMVTEPWGFESKHSFLNAAVRVLTELSPLDLLHVTQQIERKLGRSRKSVDGRYHDRIIDIDIMLYDNIELHTPNLTIPHAHLHERDFMLTPLKEILISNEYNLR